MNADTFRPLFCRACGGRIGEVSTTAFRLRYEGRLTEMEPMAPVQMVVTTTCRRPLFVPFTNRSKPCDAVNRVHLSFDVTSPVGLAPLTSAILSA